MQRPGRGGGHPARPAESFLESIEMPSVNLSPSIKLDDKILRFFWINLKFWQSLLFQLIKWTWHTFQNPWFNMRQFETVYFMQTLVTFERIRTISSISPPTQSVGGSKTISFLCWIKWSWNIRKFHTFSDHFWLKLTFIFWVFLLATKIENAEL